MMKWLEFQKSVLASVGGMRGALTRLNKMHNVRTGVLVGEDAHGNKYYQNDEYPIGRSRFVDFKTVVCIQFSVRDSILYIGLLL